LPILRRSATQRGGTTIRLFAGGQSGQPEDAEKVMRGFARLHPRAQKVIRYGRDWRLWAVCDRDPVESWVDGRVVLPGNAAHPMLP
jgi:salicylate hydroxylase